MAREPNRRLAAQPAATYGWSRDPSLQWTLRHRAAAAAAGTDKLICYFSSCWIRYRRNRTFCCV